MGNTVLSSEYWPFAFHHAIMIHNITPNQLDHKIPYELMLEYPRNQRQQIPFGCRLYVYNEQAITQGLLNNPIKATFIGYDKTVTIAWGVEDENDRIKKTSFKANIRKFSFLQNNNGDEDPDVPEPKANFNIDLKTTSEETNEGNDNDNIISTGNSLLSQNFHSSTSTSRPYTVSGPLPTPKTP